MKEIEECAPESQNTTNIAEDAISLVFGKEIRGRVREMGFGVTTAKVGATLKQNGTIKTTSNYDAQPSTRSATNEVKCFPKYEQQNEQEQVGSGGSIGIGNDIGSGCDINRPKKSGNADNVNQHQVVSRLNLKNVNHGDIPENTKCKLLHWCGHGVVAEGRIAQIQR
ncbi:uncharacterized protein [Primulina eburnea]|uniref:uncharacterized protein n=1 Tax=Primulina eburnea TaxID=1245227 RepID=UPI003C6C95F6